MNAARRNCIPAWGRVVLWLAFAAAPLAAQDRINSEGRVLGPPVPVLQPTLFNTPEADVALSAMQIFPADNAWHEDVSARPYLGGGSNALSNAMMAQIGADLLSTRQKLYAFFEMNYVLAPDAQPGVDINFFDYPDESDPPPYPLPPDQPIESWPHETGALTLDEWQQDINNDGGDRHSLTVQPGAGLDWETWQAKFVPATGWEASNGAKFNLASNALRPAGWTSGDAAGLAMFPALVRYDECQRGVIDHALRQVVGVSRTAYLYPATHYASTSAMATRPAMGQRMRLKAAFVVPGSWSVCEKAVAAAYKKYGALVADNGNFYSISVTPDSRWSASEFSNLGAIALSNFEVVESTTATTGPRAPGAPTAFAGVDKSVAAATALALGDAAATGTSVAVLWTKYAGPGTVTFSNASTLHPTATFSAGGRYLLELKVTDTLGHAPAWSVVAVTVIPACSLPGAALNLSRLRKGAGGAVILDLTDGNAGSTGYDLYRAPAAATRPVLWSAQLTGAPDADGATAGIQLNDPAAGSALWFYTAAAKNGCGEGPW